MKLLQKKLSEFTYPQQLKERGLYSFYHRLESGQDTEVYMRGQKLLMFGSNSYLGLTNHPELVKAAKDALDKYGTGSSGSRLMNGNLDIHEELEEKLAAFVGKPAAAIFGTGFQVNMGVIPSLVGRNDYLVIDEKSHASIIEGSRLTFAKTLKFDHNDMASLEKALLKTDITKVTLIVTEGVFSMEGDLAPLDKVVELAKKYNASIMLDDAHGLGVMGKNGSGTAGYFNCTDQTDIIMSTFSKSFASLGGFVASDEATINYIKHHARSLLFSAAMPPANAATVLKVLDIFKQEPERIESLWDNVRYAKQCLMEAGFDIGNSASPIIPIFIGDNIKTYVFASSLLKYGIYVNPVVHPAVEEGKSILRFSLMATHTKTQIDQAVQTLIKVREEVEEEQFSLTI